MLKQLFGILIFLIISSGFAMANEERPKSLSLDAGPKAFKILKEKSIDPKTGLPETLDPNLFKGKAKQAYQVAK